jgi:choline dehydrogenase-like flavoprotein
LATARTQTTTERLAPFDRPGPGATGYLSKREIRWLAAIAEAVLPVDASVPPIEVAENVDRYMTPFRARRKWIVKVAVTGVNLYPLLHLKATLAGMTPDKRREFIRTRFLRAIERRTLLPFVRGPLLAGIRFVQQMSFLGYYSDPRSFPETGYVPATKRERFKEAMASRPPVPDRVTTIPHADVRPVMEADVVIVGSGAAGAVFAYRLVQEGRSVLVLERGRHIEPKDFSEDEVTQITTLYADGALQQAQNFAFTVLQGACVGGTTVVNNAVSFDLPADVLHDWNAGGAGLDERRLYQSFERIRHDMRIKKQTDAYIYKGAQRFVDGVHAMDLKRRGYDMDLVDANVHACPGSGYCNIGCKFGAKLSMLDTLLPEGQRNGPGKLQIIAECTATKVRDTAAGAEVDAELWGGRKVTVKGGAVVVSAGPIASSWLLMQSKLGGKRAGKGLSFNMGSPITADFDEQQCSYDGLQITHYVRPPSGSGFMLETWFNPVVSQALNMPGWLEDHARNMRRYDHLAAAGALVGTTATGEVRRALTGGPDIRFVPERGDMERLIGALELVGEIYLRAGATRVMPNTFRYHEFTEIEQLSELRRYVKDGTDLAIGTGHPQGGNALGEDRASSVVGPDFKVHGTDHVFLCDASIFPSSVTVNPQLTVMALADYAAPSVLAG